MEIDDGTIPIGRVLHKRHHPIVQKFCNLSFNCSCFLQIVSYNLCVAVNRSKRNNNFSIPCSKAEAKSSEQLRANKILVTPSADVKPNRFTAAQLCAFQDGVVVEELCIGFEDDVAASAGKN